MVTDITSIDRCATCLDEKCKGTHNCNCKTCSHLKECYKFLHATIRITNKCTQECEHCCFASNPRSTIMMDVDTLKRIGKFLDKNNIAYINVMGGEFFCNPSWYEIFNNLVNSVYHMRIVSNGDWVASGVDKAKLRDFINNYRDKINISISNDSYHNNKNVAEAENWLSKQNISYNIGIEDKLTEDKIVPLGRGISSYGYYSFAGCFCQNQTQQYSFLIDEQGKIYKCAMGVWNYATIDEYIDGGFSEKFKEFNKKFYNIFLPSCRQCIMSAMRKDRIIKY